jgi:hypothetical protein
MQDQVNAAHASRGRVPRIKGKLTGQSRRCDPNTSGRFGPSSRSSSDRRFVQTQTLAPQQKCTAAKTHHSNRDAACADGDTAPNPVHRGLGHTFCRTGEEFLAALLPRCFEFGRWDVPVRPAFFRNGTQVLAEIFHGGPTEEPIAVVDLMNGETGLAVAVGQSFEEGVPAEKACWRRSRAPCIPQTSLGDALAANAWSIASTGVAPMPALSRTAGASPGRSVNAPRAALVSTTSPTCSFPSM